MNQRPLISLLLYMQIKTKIARVQSSLLLTLVSLLVTFGFLVPVYVAANPSVDVWWPTDGAKVSSVQPFKTMVKGLDVKDYDMFWQVDGDKWNKMENNYTDYQHKESMVDVGSWNWHGSGPYTINFIAQKEGKVIAEQEVSIMVHNGLPEWSASSNDPTVVPATTPTDSPIVITTTKKPQATTTLPVTATTTAPVPPPPPPTSFYVNPNSSAGTQAVFWKNSNPTGAAAMMTLAAQPTATWLGGWNSNVQADAHTIASAAQAKNQTAVFVAYNIPQRDCGGYSAGGSNNPDGYRSWIKAVAAGIGSARAIVVLEPDALAQLNCLSSTDQQTRLQLLTSAVTTLKSNANTKVYIDAGHSNWVDPGTMAQKLSQANIGAADGFALNVSNFMSTSDESSYGSQISSKVNGKHFVIDTSRNGNGGNGQWCNPSGRAIGAKPTTATNNSLIDALLWLKTPGESDGLCNGGPSAGTWWPDYALQLVQNAH